MAESFLDNLLAVDYVLFERIVLGIFGAIDPTGLYTDDDIWKIIMTMELDVGFECILKAFTKMTTTLENFSKPKFSAEEYMVIYSTIYTLCTGLNHSRSREVYNKYRDIFEDYIYSTVLVSLKEKHEEDLLREFVRRWKNHEIMVMWMSKFFNYLDRYFIITKQHPCVKDVAISCFRDLVYKELKVEIQAAVAALVNKLSHEEREGKQVERALLENVQSVILEIDPLP